jgi:hypothetical protein
MAVSFVALFAGLLASFPARNGDLWLHLAAGRRLAQGGPSLAVVPGAAASHTWLYDLLCYGLHSVLGDPGLVAAKAAGVVALALVLLRLSRAGRGWSVVAACTALALLAMSTRLLLQPATVSYLLLALAFLLDKETRRQGDKETIPPSSLRAWLPPWPLAVLFVVWANVDGRFVFGLATVALTWLGRALDTAGSVTGRLTAVLRALSCALCLAAVCLLNPAHVGAFVLPSELAAFWAPEPSAASGLGQVASPFEPAWFANLGLSPAGLAYFPLLGLGLLSFIVNLPRWHWQRFLPWLGLALLSACQVRAVPFFAVVAGPVLAWNVQELLARRPRADAPASSPGLLVSLSSFLLGCLGAGLLVCAWPGWLQAPPFEPRRWAVEAPPSLKRGAAEVQRWHKEGRLGPDSRGLHLSRDAAYAFAWFCPEEDGLFDDGIAAALRDEPAAPDDWAERMRAAGADHVIVYDPDSDRLLATLGRLLGAPQEWPLLHLEGGVAVFGWRGAAGSAERFRGWKHDLNRFAFRPADDKRAPHERSERAPEPRRWWDAFWRPAPPPWSLDRDEARLDLLCAEALRRSALRVSPYRRLAAWEAGQAAALVGAAGGWSGPSSLLDAELRLVLVRPPLPERGAGGAPPPLSQAVLHCQQWYALLQDDTPPALLYLAVRAARRALAVNPADARANLVLGQSYLRLLHETRERAWALRVRELAQLRGTQASAALNRALALNPELAPAHLSLGELYREMGYLDLALKHLREHQKLAGASAGLDEKEVSSLAEAVAARETAYAAEASKMRVQERAVLAYEKGLRGKARDLLLGSDVSAFGKPGMALELELLLRTGRPQDVAEWVGPEESASLGALNYHWLRAQSLAASGDYARAEEECERLAAEGRGGRSAAQLREVMALLAVELAAGAQPAGASLAHLPWRGLGLGPLYGPPTRGLREEANANTMRGLLLLEEGNADEAEVAFRLALALWKDEAAVASGAGLDFKDRPIAAGCLPWLESEADKETR